MFLLLSINNTYTWEPYFEDMLCNYLQYLERKINLLIV